MSIHFWKTQPIGIAKSKSDSGEEITDLKKFIIEKVKFPKEFHIEYLDRNNTDKVKEISIFLEKNYIQDFKETCLLLYTTEFLSWFLEKSKNEWCIILKKNDVIVGFVAAVTRKIVVCQKEKYIAEVNFLCLHKDYRNLNFAPLLIQKVTENLIQDNIFQAVYTCGKKLPQDYFVSTSYYHKFLDFSYLLESKFLLNYSLQQSEFVYKKKENQNFFFRPVLEKDVEYLVELYQSQCETKDFYENLDTNFFENFLKKNNNNNFLHGFVVEKVDFSNKTKVIVGFISFYDLDFYVSETTKIVKTIYVYYCFGDFNRVLDNVFLYFQKNSKHMVISGEISESKQIVDYFSMIKGSGKLYYYLYNFKILELSPENTRYIIF